MTLRALAALALAVTLAACSVDLPTAPPPHQPAILVSLELVPPRVSGGETVRFVVTASNPSDQRVRISDRCGLPVDVHVLLFPTGTAPVGGGPNTACEPEPHQFLEARASASWELTWTAPHGWQDVRVVAGTRQAWGLDHRTPQMVLQVR